MFLIKYILLITGCLLVSFSQTNILPDWSGLLLVVGIVNMIWGSIWDLV